MMGNYWPLTHPNTPRPYPVPPPTFLAPQCIVIYSGPFSSRDVFFPQIGLSMTAVTLPFATVSDLQDRWPDLPPGSTGHAATLLEDASQFMLDVVPSTVDARPGTRRRIVCAVVRRAMEASAGGMTQMTMTAGPFNVNQSPSNPHGDFYLTRNERHALGYGRQKAFSVEIGQ